jgi:hypothetical protein
MVRPNGMEQKTEPQLAGKAGERDVKQRKTEWMVIHEERIIQVDAPAGTSCTGYEDLVVQDFVLRPRGVCIRRERWLTPDGPTILASKPVEPPSRNWA